MARRISSAIDLHGSAVISAVAGRLTAPQRATASAMGAGTSPEVMVVSAGVPDIFDCFFFLSGLVSASENESNGRRINEVVADWSSIPSDAERMLSIVGCVGRGVESGRQVDHWRKGARRARWWSGRYLLWWVGGAKAVVLALGELPDGF